MSAGPADLSAQAEIEELVRTSSSLVWLQQRRKYAGTFYTTLDMFRSTHDAPPPSPPAAAVPEPMVGGGSPGALDGTSPALSGPAGEASPPPPTIQIEEVATPTPATTATTPTLVEPESSGPADRLGHAARERSWSRSSRERGASEREGSEGRQHGDRPRHRHHHERAPSGGSRHHLDARSSYESASGRSGEGDDESRERRRRRRRRRARADEEHREDRGDRRSQGGSDSGFASLFSFAKGGLRK